MPTALILVPLAALAASQQTRYYGHATVEDEHGIIAPWYGGLNGQFDYRVRIAAETLKRYPWVTGARARAFIGPEYLFNGTWRITEDGQISVPDLRDWDNGDLGQRAAYVLSAFVDYYRYSGDPTAIAHMTLMADFLLGQCQTGPDHPWPGMLISVPVKGVPYGQADPHGMIQLDIVAEAGLALLRAWQVTGETRWLEACKRWGDFLAAHRNTEPGLPPWNRYANPEDVSWDDQMTGGVAFLLAFFDELIRVGHRGKDEAIVEARDAGRAWLRDVLLPRWTVDDTWGRNYWDWPDPVQAENVTEFVARYMMEHPDVFPNWRHDVRNIVTLFFNRTSVSPASSGDTYSGAWAFPESSGCCGRSLWYGPMEMATVLAEYGARAESPWATELARRMQILATYDVHETGVVEDNLDGGQIVAGSWFKITHPMPLKHVLGTMAWMPGLEGANRENHIMRSGAVVRHVTYGKGRIAYTTFDAPENTVDVLRLAFHPERVTLDDEVASRHDTLEANGYRVKDLGNGDCLVSIRHDGRTRIVVEGADPQHFASAEHLGLGAPWSPSATGAYGTAQAGASLDWTFTGNQIRVIGGVGRNGGLADVVLDGEPQRAPIDCWNPSERAGQVLFYRNGLDHGEHTLRLLVRGQGNPVSEGAEVMIEGVQWSDATGEAGYGSGGGPREPQRLLLGYTGREDYVDSQGHAWRPGTEWVLRAGHLADVVKQGWWMERRRLTIADTSDPELYRYGAHGPEFWVNLTVGPGTWTVRLKFMAGFEFDATDPLKRAVTILVNGEERAADLDIAAAAGGYNRAMDLVFEGVAAKNGVIELRFINRHGGEAFVQAIEITPASP